ncbi:MAG: hypothetical protein H7Z42_09405 [Roseiflexaceae bacterium]|nr:hypothetical protein [Roseiflexaceae bacterium]
MRSSIWTPPSVILAGIVFIALLVVPRPKASIAQDQDYPAQTAAAAATATAYLDPNATAGVRTPVPPTATTGASQTTTTATGTLTPRPSTGTPQQRTPTSTPQITRTPIIQTAMPTPTPVGDLVACAPGSTVTISGQGPANAGFLLYFGERIVSGGTVRRDGFFSIELRVGREAAGRYVIEVRDRGSRAALKKLTCDVPMITPTLLPTR